MTILPRLCSSCSDRYLRMLPALMTILPRLCSSGVTGISGCHLVHAGRNLLSPWRCCSESFQSAVSIFCLDFMALLRNKRCLSPPLIKITGVQAFRWEMGDTLCNFYYIKDREKRIDSWPVSLLTVMLWGNKLCFFLLSKLLCRFNPSSVALREESDMDPHQRISDSILTIVWWPCLVPGLWPLCQGMQHWQTFYPESWRLCLLHLFADLRLIFLTACDVSLGCSALSRHIQSLSFPICAPAEWVPPCCCRSESGRAAQGPREEQGSAKPGLRPRRGAGSEGWRCSWLPSAAAPSTSPRRDICRRRWGLLSTRCSCSKRLSAGCG